VITVNEVRDYVRDFPRSYEVLVRGRIKFRVGQIVWLAFSRDETVMGFAFPKEERHMLVETYPEKFTLPSQTDMRARPNGRGRDGRDARVHPRRLADGRPEKGLDRVQRSARRRRC